MAVNEKAKRVAALVSQGMPRKQATAEITNLMRFEADVMVEDEKGEAKPYQGKEL